jgi:acetyltransferase-like isoleucine patch superfamily enzyme
VIIIFNSTIGHDVAISDYSTLGPGVHIAGCVKIGKRVFIGAGTVIVNGTLAEPLVIGDDTVVGAGSCVIRSLPAGSYVFGNPARPIPK